MAFQLVNFNLIIVDIYAKIKKLLRRVNSIESSVTVLETSVEDILNTPSVGSLPEGGTVGQVLAKINSTDYNTEWVTPSAGGASDIEPTIIRNNLIAEYLLDEGAGQIARNNVYNTIGDGNLLYPAYLFNSAPMSAVGATVTHNYAAAPNGEITATRVVSAGGNHYYPHVGNNLALQARTYTYSIYVKSNTGGNQTFRVAIYTGGYQYSGTLTATTAWQRFSFSYTLASPVTVGGVLVISTDASNTAMDVSIWGAKLEEGSAATSVKKERWDMCAGTSFASTTSDPEWTNTGIFTSGAQSLRSFNDTAVTVNTTSVYAVARWRTGQSPHLAGYMPLVSTPYVSSRIAISGGDTDNPTFQFNTTKKISLTSTLNDGLWHIITGVYDGTNMKLFIDGGLVAITSPAPISPVTFQQLFIGNFNDSGYWPGDIAYASIYNTGHSTAEVQSNLSALRVIMAQRSILLENLPVLLVSEGDSLTEGGGSNNYVKTANAAITPIIQGNNFAVPGSSLVTLESRASTVDLCYDATRSKNLFFVLIGANDLAGAVPATWVASLKAYCLARKATGWEVIIGTVLPRTAGGFNANRNAANSLILADPSFYDAVADFAANPTIGADASASNATYYYDGTHLTTAGYNIMAPILQTAIESLL